MTNKILHITICIILLVIAATGVMAQRVSFGLYASDDITLTPGNVDVLNFNSKQTLIVAGNTISIPNHLDEFAAVITISGRSDLDVTVTIDSPFTLDLNAENIIPLTLGFAYSNMGSGGDVASAKTQAIQVPAGFTTATFPIYRQAAGPPGAPPTPDHIGYTQPTGMAYLFIYGTLGPVPNDAAAGLYSGEINIYVEYSTYD